MRREGWGRLLESPELPRLLGMPLDKPTCLLMPAVSSFLATVISLDMSDFAALKVPGE